jgi:HSP20 family protein
MTKLAKREGLFEELFDFRQNLDELFSRMLSHSPWISERVAQLQTELPPVEAWIDKEGKSYHARVALPGIEPQNVQLNIQGNSLSIRGERREAREAKDVNYLCREISYGVVDRTLTLPEGVETDKITAECANGVLDISAPIASAALPRRIEIKTAVKAKTAGG